MWTPLPIHPSLTTPPALDTALGDSPLEVRTGGRPYLSQGGPYLCRPPLSLEIRVAAGPYLQGGISLCWEKLPYGRLYLQWGKSRNVRNMWLN